jgi:hypothetical protein
VILRVGGKYLSRDKTYEITILGADPSKNGWATSYRHLNSGKTYKEYILQKDGSWNVDDVRCEDLDAVYELSSTDEYLLEE